LKEEIVGTAMIRTPFLWPSFATPPAERAAIRELNALLTGLGYSVEAWEAGLLLYELAKHPSSTAPGVVARRWRFIACHECVFELYHLRARLEKIQSVHLRKCPSLRTAIDAPKLRSARKKLDEYFPDIGPLRHAIAHRGENEAHPEVHAPEGQYALTGFREEDVYSAPYEGRLCQLEITQLSLLRITDVVLEFFSAFEPASAELEKQGHME
jgi:hypothetical protein